MVSVIISLRFSDLLCSCGTYDLNTNFLRKAFLGDYIIIRTLKTRIVPTSHKAKGRNTFFS